MCYYSFKVINMKEYLNKCPVCRSDLHTIKYRCSSCHTEIEGTFRGSKFSTLSEEHLDFIEIFVMNRGSIKEIEKVLGISYPSVRSKLDEVIQALGHNIDAGKSRVEILQMLDDGIITAAEATKLLEELEG